MSKDFDYYYDRLEVYKDSIEVADGVEIFKIHLN